MASLLYTPQRKWHPFHIQDKRNSSLGLSIGWPRPLNRGDRLIQVSITVIKGRNFRDFDNWPLNRGWPLNTVPLNTGSTVFRFNKTKQSTKANTETEFKGSLTTESNTNFGTTLLLLHAERRTEMFFCWDVGRGGHLIINFFGLYGWAFIRGWAVNRIIKFWTQKDDAAL